MEESTPEEWPQESMTVRSQPYDVPQDREIGYADRTLQVKQRLLQAGVRLAAVFNAIYG